MSWIDLNADLGEAADAAGREREQQLLDLVSSASIACGGHAGDARSFARLAQLAAARGVAVGAHPSYPDRAGLGRRETGASAQEIAAAATGQLALALAASAAAGARLAYVKPHGALYHRLARDADAACAFVESVAVLDLSLAILGPPGGALLVEAQRAGLAVAREGFLDRGYRADAGLVARGEAGAFLRDPREVAARALRFARRDPIAAVDGTSLALEVDSLCVHGDEPSAIEVLAAARAALVGAGVAIRPFAAWHSKKGSR